MRYRAALLMAALALVPHMARAASFTPLGDLPGESVASHASAVSDDGTVVVGQGSSTVLEAFRWSGGAMVGLGVLPGGGELGSIALNVSATGSVVVGYSYAETTGYPTYQAFRWSGGVMTGLGFLPGYTGSSARGVSADGEVVVGNLYDPEGASPDQAYRWADGTMTPLSSLFDGGYTVANDVSADGAVIVGSSSGAEGEDTAVRWSSGVLSSLSGFPEGVLWSSASAVSPDGAFVVGSMGGEIGDQAFRWTESGMLGLGYLSDANPYPYSIASDVSADGAVVVGWSSGDEDSYAFVWTESGGMQRLIDVLSANGVTGLEGWRLIEANGVSADGRWISGTATNPDGFLEGFLADISPVPEPSAAWLVGSALAALACARRRIAF